MSVRKMRGHKNRVGHLSKKYKAAQRFHFLNFKDCEHKV